MPEPECSHCGRLLNDRGYCWWCEPHLASPLDPTPTSTDVVPVAEFRALLVEWDARYHGSWGAERRVSRECWEALATLLARYTPEGE